MRLVPAAGPRLRRRHEGPASDLPALPVAAGLTDAQRRTTHMVVALLLDYPRARADEDEARIDAAIAGLPPALRTSLASFRAQARDMGPDALAAHYVQTFDLKRRCALYLTYYQAGDTRRRGMALVTFVEAYRAAGWEPEPDELPDYLPTVLELSARTGDALACPAARGRMSRCCAARCTTCARPTPCCSTPSAPRSPRSTPTRPPACTRSSTRARRPRQSGSASSPRRPRSRRSP